MNDPYGNGNKNDISNMTGFTDYNYIYNQPIEYGKAIEILHYELYSIALEPMEEEI